MAALAASSDDAEVVAALAAVRRAGETARGSVGELDVTARPEVLSRRITAAAAQLGVLRAAISAPSLRYQALRPAALPLVPAHVPVHGLVIDPSTGRLELLVDGNKRSSRPVALLDSPETSEPLTVLRSPRAVAGSGVTGGGQRFSDVTEASISLTGRSGDFVEN